MRQLKVLKQIIFSAALLAAGAASATDGSETLDALSRWQEEPRTIFEASEVDIDAFKWIARPVVVFSDTPANPAFQQQMNLLTARIEELVARDVILIVDTDPEERSDLRRKLRPRGFMLTLIGKDGGVKLRKPFPWDVRELTRSIDKMPLRLQELRERRASE